MHYNLENFFMMRCPVNYANDFFSLLEKIDIQEYYEFIRNKGSLQEAFAVASLDFSNHLERYFSGNELPNRKGTDTVLGYISRAYTRPTPFGFFSGITSGKFSEVTKVIINNQPIKSRLLQVDTEWFYSLINKLERNEDIVMNLNVVFNNNCFKFGSRYKNPYVSDFGTQSEIKNQSSIRLNDQTRFIYDNTKSPIKFKLLLNKLQELNPDVPPRILTNFLIKLVESEYLITELRIVILEQDPLLQISDRIKEMELTGESKFLAKNINHICCLIEEFNSSGLPNIVLYKNICRSMEKISPQKSYLNGLMAIQTTDCYIGSDISNILLEFTHFLERTCSLENEPVHIKNYKAEFRLKYGANTAINILELFDETIGIGSPYAIKYFKEQATNNKKEKDKSYLVNKILSCIKTGSTTVVIQDKDIDNLSIGDKERILPYTDSFDLCFSIRAINATEIDKGDYELILHENYGNSGAGNFYNRFFRVLDVSAKEDLSNMYSKIKVLNNNYMIVDAKELPRNGRVSNVNCGKLNYDYTLTMGTYNDNTIDINLKDLYICYDERVDRLFIYSKSKMQIVKVISNNMLNPASNNQFIRFLREITNGYDIHPLSAITSYKQLQLPYIPKIVYKKVIIQNETWNFNADKNISFATFKTLLDDFKATWNMARYVYIVVLDNKVLIDLENNLWVEFAFHKFQKYGMLHLTKCEYNPNAWPWVCDINGHAFSSEFVASFLLANPYKLPFKIKHKIGSYFDKDRILFVGESNWLYFKIFVNPDNYNKIITHIYNKMNHLFSMEIIDKYFYIRYSEGGDHLRLRLHYIEKKVDLIVKEIFNWLISMKNDLLISRFTIDCYEREIERYGGPNTINIAEEVFFHDSIFVSAIIKFSNPSISLEIIGVIAIQQILDVFLESSKKINESLDRIISKNDYKTDYRKIKHILLEAQLNEKLFDIDPIIHSLFQNRKQSLEYYKRSLCSLNNDIEEIMLVLIHMFCNRISGDRNWERKVLAFTRHRNFDLYMRDLHYTGR